MMMHVSFSAKVHKVWRRFERTTLADAAVVSYRLSPNCCDVSIPVLHRFTVKVRVTAHALSWLHIHRQKQADMTGKEQVAWGSHHCQAPPCKATGLWIALFAKLQIQGPSCPMSPAASHWETQLPPGGFRWPPFTLKEQDHNPSSRKEDWFCRDGQEIPHVGPDAGE